MIELFRIFWIFAKIGVLTFGGGYTMLPMLRRETVESGWLTEDDVADYYALAQCLPGLIGVNVSILIGHNRRKAAGGIVAALGIITPSIIIILIIAVFLTNFAHLEVVRHAFAGIRVAVSVLIIQSVYRLSKNALTDLPTIIISLVALVLVMFKLASPIIPIILAAIAGFILKKRGERI